MNSVMTKWRYRTLAGICCLATVLCVGCKRGGGGGGGGGGSGGSGDVSGGSGGGGADNQPKVSLPDLTVSTIEVFPSEPQAGKAFTVNVYVKNAGEAPSGTYDVALFIRDIGRGQTYPIGTFRKEALQPGENVVAYTSNERLVNNPGNYQLHAEITPFQFNDGNMMNNAVIKAFAVR